MKKILEFDFLSGPIYKDIYYIKNNEIITGIDELDKNKKIMSLNQEIQDIYASFYDQNRLSEDDPFNHLIIENNIEKLFRLKNMLIGEIENTIPDVVIEDRTIDFFKKYLNY